MDYCPTCEWPIDPVTLACPCNLAGMPREIEPERPPLAPEDPEADREEAMRWMK